MVANVVVVVDMDESKPVAAINMEAATLLVVVNIHQSPILPFESLSLDSSATSILDSTIVASGLLVLGVCSHMSLS